MAEGSLSLLLSNKLNKLKCEKIVNLSKKKKKKRFVNIDKYTVVGGGGGESWIAQGREIFKSAPALDTRGPSCLQRANSLSELNYRITYGLDSKKHEKGHPLKPPRILQLRGVLKITSIQVGQHTNINRPFGKKNFIFQNDSRSLNQFLHLSK